MGSTRIMYSVEPGVIALRYTDRWSAFDRGSSAQLIPGIGAARCACAVKSFQLVGNLLTHFIEQVGSETIHVHEFSIPDHEPLSGKMHGRVLPVEWIWRDRVYGSLLERVKSGKVNPITLGFAPDTMVTEGMKLPCTLVECTTKFEPIDRHLWDDEVMGLAQITPSQWINAQDLLTNAVRVTNAVYDAVDFMCPDGKLELGMLPNDTIVLVDVFGTQDENRIIDKATGAVYSKDLIRNWLNKQPWKAGLTRAKAEHPGNKSKWPPYPKLPADLVELVSERYAEVAYRYSGVRISY